MKPAAEMSQISYCKYRPVSIEQGALAAD